MCVACLLFHTPTQCIFPREARNARDRHYAGAHYRRHQEKDKFTELNMNTGDDETESISSISTLHSRNTDTQGGLNCGARFKQINERLNRQDKRINEISQKVDNVASAMKNFKNDVKADCQVRSPRGGPHQHGLRGNETFHGPTTEGGAGETRPRQPHVARSLAQPWIRPPTTPSSECGTGTPTASGASRPYYNNKYNPWPRLLT